MSLRIFIATLFLLLLPMKLFAEEQQPTESHLSGYIADVERRTQRKFHPPKEIEKTIKAIVQFKIVKPGNAVDIRFRKHSKNLAFDDAVRNSISSTRYRSFPTDIFLKAEFDSVYVKVEQDTTIK